MRFLLVACVALVACSGAETSPLFDGGATDAAADAQTGGDSGTACDKLLADLEAKRQVAVQCCLTCGTLQCTQQIDGLCCPLTVSSSDALSSTDYKAALKAVKDAHCPVDCPNLACSQKPTNVCGQNGTCSQ